MHISTNYVNQYLVANRNIMLNPQLKLLKMNLITVTLHEYEILAIYTIGHSAKIQT